MEINKIQSKSKSKSKSLLLLCPTCKTNIPNITFHQSTYQEQTQIQSEAHEDYLEINCKCSSTSFSIHLSAYLTQLKEQQSSTETIPYTYCTICHQWLESTTICNEHEQKYPNHILHNTPINLSCAIHKEPIRFHCDNKKTDTDKCNKSLCKKCLPNHKDHSITSLPCNKLSLFLIKIIRVRYKAISEFNEKQKNCFIIKLASSTMADAINASYENNRKRNEQKMEFIELIKSTIHFLKEYINYNITDILPGLMSNINQLFTVDKYTSLVNTSEKLDEFKQQFALPTERFLLRQSQIEAKLLEYITLVIKYKKMKNHCLGTMKGHDADIVCLIQLQDGRIASSSNDESIRIWNSTTYQCLTILSNAHDFSVNCIIQLPLNGNIISCGSDNLIKIWDLTHCTLVKTLTGHKEQINSIILLKGYSKDYDCFASVDANSSLKLWNLTTFTEIPHQLKDLAHFNESIIQLANGNIATCGSDNKVNIWNLTTMELLGSYKHDAFVNGMIELPQNTIASYSCDGEIKLWDSKTFQSKGELIGHDKSVTKMVKLSDERVASAGFDNVIHIWKLEWNKMDMEIEGDVEKSFIGHDRAIIALMKMNDGRLVSASKYLTKDLVSEIKVWRDKENIENDFSEDDDIDMNDDDDDEDINLDDLNIDLNHSDDIFDVVCNDGDIDIDEKIQLLELMMKTISK